MKKKYRFETPEYSLEEIQQAEDLAEEASHADGTETIDRKVREEVRPPSVRQKYGYDYPLNRFGGGRYGNPRNTRVCFGPSTRR